MIKTFTLYYILILNVHLYQACTNQTTVSCAISNSTTRVISVFGNPPQGNCTLVKIGNDVFLYDPIMINSVWITLNNTNSACIVNIGAQAQMIFSLLNYPSTMEVVLLNVTAQYYRMVVVTRGCTNCSVNTFSSDLETRLRSANLTLYPIFNDLNPLGPYCLNGGTIDTTYTGAGYRCVCPKTAIFLGPSCENMEVSFTNVISYFNVFKSATTINFRFSIFSIGITSFISLFTIKTPSYQKLVEVTINESVFNVSLLNPGTTPSTLTMTVDNQIWYDIDLVLSQTNATLTVNYKSVVVPFSSALTLDFRSLYLLINEGNLSTSKICLKNVFANSKILNLFNPMYNACCMDRCSCASTQDCDCHPFTSLGNTMCYCKNSFLPSGTNCTSNNIILAQLNNSVTATFQYNNYTLNKVDFGFQTLSTVGSLLNLSFSNPPLNIVIQIVNTNLTLNATNARLRTINCNVSDGRLHNVTLFVTPYSLQMIIDSNYNYTTYLVNWFTSKTFPGASSIISLTSMSLGIMQLPFVSTINLLTTCFSNIRFNSMGVFLDTYPSLNPSLSSQCVTGPRCSSGVLNCSANQVCMDTEWQFTKCICIANFTSVNSTCTYNQCIPNPCQNNGTCYYNSAISSYSCLCTSSFGGTNCTVAVVPASLWWIAVLIVLLLLLIVIIVVVVYCCCYRNQKPVIIPFISKINENIVTYNDQAGECDYSGPPIDFTLMKIALNNPGIIANGPNKPLPGLMNKKETFDNNNKDLILDHPLEYGYEGYNSDNGSISSIGSKSAGSQVDIDGEMNDIYNKT